ncbi:MAG: GNAT family N-acetyltransferase [Okeania sp. SIO2F4]|uniref:GNAT family N-acetyltransferase n=1 Tax=Okeania sp. SIO2F4 TaxID=2607790 RepID=UPI0014299320|nr:GNAT family N-acetyltransferase [Okeania sp. SIO2F4]NES03046.1 GNAT family N-acetyltransferase [Okeania sp. SIO2F4]
MTEIVLPNSCNLRPASAKDIWSIRKLVLTAKLDPTQLHWQQFWVIESDGNLVACGQLRNFEYAQELGSLVVVKAWQKRGLGTTLTKYLIQQATKPLYLECLGKKLEYFYSRLDFVPISLAELPQSLKLKFGISQLGRKIFKIPVIIMKYKGNKLINSN